jgi:hypothetical protein
MSGLVLSDTWKTSAQLVAGDIMSCSTKFLDDAVMWEKDTRARDLKGTALTRIAYRVANTNPVGLPGYDVVVGTVNTRVGEIITTSAAAWQRPVNGTGNPTGLFVLTMPPAPNITALLGGAGGKQFRHRGGRGPIQSGKSSGFHVVWRGVDFRQ